MLVLVTYDIRTDSREGRRRLRQVARACLDYGQRVQIPYSSVTSIRPSGLPYVPACAT